MTTKINKKLDLIRRIRKHTLFYSVAYLDRQFIYTLECLVRLAEDGVFGGE